MPKLSRTVDEEIAAAEAIEIASHVLTIIRSTPGLE
jgi:hypothetical protein